MLLPKYKFTKIGLYDIVLLRNLGQDLCSSSFTHPLRTEYSGPANSPDTDELSLVLGRGWSGYSCLLERLYLTRGGFVRIKTRGPYTRTST